MYIRMCVCVMCKLLPMYIVHTDTARVLWCTDFVSVCQCI